MPSSRRDDEMVTLKETTAQELLAEGVPLSYVKCISCEGTNTIRRWAECAGDGTIHFEECQDCGFVWRWWE